MAYSRGGGLRRTISHPPSDAQTPRRDMFEILFRSSFSLPHPPRAPFPSTILLLLLYPIPPTRPPTRTPTLGFYYGIYKLKKFAVAKCAASVRSL